MIVRNDRVKISLIFYTQNEGMFQLIYTYYLLFIQYSNIVSRNSSFNEQCNLPCRYIFEQNNYFSLKHP